MAHHEAAHAVLAAVHGRAHHGFTLNETFLNAPGGALGGFTGWNGPDVPLNQQVAEATVKINLAGQIAEQHLAAVNRLVHVPRADANWDDDNAHAALELNGPALLGNAGAAAQLRTETRELVKEYWRAVMAIAHELMAPAPRFQAGPVSTPRDPRPFAPVSRIVSGDEVRSYVLENDIANVALARWKVRGYPRGTALEDWIAAEKDVARHVPGILERWIAEANQGAARWLARFEFPSPAEAQQAVTRFNLIPNTASRPHGMQTTVLVEFPPDQVGAVACLARRPGVDCLR